MHVPQQARRAVGEHGTGRNVAPFVEMEWGAKAYELMWELKRVFDPGFVLNPGVLLNRDPDAHRKFLKPSPVASEIVNRYASHALHCLRRHAACPGISGLSASPCISGLSVFVVHLRMPLPLAQGHLCRRCIDTLTGSVARSRDTLTGSVAC
jgi:FAD linked oxidases, C-terminal domain